jgi:hypothetical protein
VLIFVDNATAISAITSGTSSAHDLRAISTQLWDWLAVRKVTLHVRYVPSALNLADAPSRGRAPALGARIPAEVNWTFARDWLAAAPLPRPLRARPVTLSAPPSPPHTLPPRRCRRAARD